MTKNDLIESLLHNSSPNFRARLGGEFKDTERQLGEALVPISAAWGAKIVSLTLNYWVVIYGQKNSRVKEKVAAAEKAKRHLQPPEHCTEFAQWVDDLKEYVLPLVGEAIGCHYV